MQRSIEYSKGSLHYLYQVCQKISEGAQKHYIPEQESPYITYADQWVGYDDADSLALKVSDCRGNKISKSTAVNA